MQLPIMDEPVDLSFECAELPSPHWIVASAELLEPLDEPYSLLLELRCEELSARGADFLGKSCELQINRGGLSRSICGVVVEVKDGGTREQESAVSLQIAPALMALQRQKKCRIFQDQSIPDILKVVVGETLAVYGRSVDDRLRGNYKNRDYAVQYNESDYDFMCRLMHEAGIYFCFEHADGKETMVWADDRAIHQEIETINGGPFLSYVWQDGGPGGTESVKEFSRRSRVAATKASTHVFDWLLPSKPGEAMDDKSVEIDGFNNGASDGPDCEEFLGGEAASRDGFQPSNTADLDERLKDHLQIARQRQQAQAWSCIGRSTATGLAPGLCFELMNHPQDDLNVNYLVTEVRHKFRIGGANDSSGDGYRNTFQCIPAQVQWRPVHSVTRGEIKGIQTATVVGPSGQEIYTDKHGRIKVAFHWDRESTRDHRSSCFVRVMQAWAGSGWGTVFLPRVGMEVIVNFINGDPDRPIVTGCVYNGQNETPYPLPDKRTKSSIFTSSSPRNGGYNELSFEDASGSEEIYMRAQKDMNTLVRNNQSNTVKVDQTELIEGNQNLEVKGNRDIKVLSDHTEHIDGKYDFTVNGGICGGPTTFDQKISVGSVQESILGNVTCMTTGNVSETITGNVTCTTTGNVTETTTGNVVKTINGTEGKLISGDVVKVVNGPKGEAKLVMAGPYLVNGATGMTLLSSGPMTIAAPSVAIMGQQSEAFFTPKKSESVGFYYQAIGAKCESHGTAIIVGIAKREHWAIDNGKLKIKLHEAHVEALKSGIRSIISKLTIMS